MKLLACPLFLALAFAAASAQSGPDSGKRQAPAASTKRPDDALAHALQIVQAERARAKQPICPNAKNTMENDLCYSKEFKTTENNYLALVRALGIVLRSDNDKPASTPTAIPFDAAETSWHTYRDLACKAFDVQFEGGTIQASEDWSCNLIVTRHHMDELWALYADYETR